jgi:D-alanine-D-alanine ligase
MFGGRSGEHEISLRSGASIVKAIDRGKYDLVLIGIAKSGEWLSGRDADALLTGVAAPAMQSTAKAGDASLSLVEASAKMTAGLDVIFPVLHGTFGEDGTIQGMLELADIAYVGSGVLGSAVSMDKAAMKTMFAAAGLPIVKHVTLLRSAWKSNPKKCTKLIEGKLKYPMFVKPANLGSSVGISKVRARPELPKAMDEAAAFDGKIVIEEGVSGNGRLKGKAKARELEIAVLGNDDPVASVVGEIVPDREFYDYASKYDAGSTSEPIIPARITKAQAKAIQAMAITAFRSCDCSGLARVDFLMEAVDPNSKQARPGSI